MSVYTLRRHADNNTPVTMNTALLAPIYWLLNTIFQQTELGYLREMAGSRTGTGKIPDGLDIWCYMKK